MRRARRAIESTLLRLDATNRVIEAAERFGAQRPIQSTRQMQRAWTWLTTATAMLGRSMRCVEESCRCAELEPQRAGVLPLLLLKTTARWVDAAGQLDAVSTRLQQTMAGLAQQVRTWTVWPDEWGTAPARAASRPVHHASLVIIRCQWFVAAVAADAARRISRGRAPPAF